MRSLLWVDDWTGCHGAGRPRIRKRTEPRYFISVPAGQDLSATTFSTYSPRAIPSAQALKRRASRRRFTSRYAST
jgi:hypothetical protein